MNGHKFRAMQGWQETPQEATEFHAWNREAELAEDAETFVGLLQVFIVIGTLNWVAS